MQPEECNRRGELANTLHKQLQTLLCMLGTETLPTPIGRSVNFVRGEPPATRQPHAVRQGRWFAHIKPSALVIPTRDEIPTRILRKDAARDYDGNFLPKHAAKHPPITSNKKQQKHGKTPS